MYNDMKDIILEGTDYTSVKIKMVDGPVPYLGIDVDDPRLTSGDRWYLIPDNELWRLRKALDKILRVKEKGYLYEIRSIFS